MSYRLKVHFYGQMHGTHITTACGKDGSQCRGFEARPGMPGEFDTPTCDRFEATIHDEDVTCGRCLKSLAKLKKDY